MDAESLREFPLYFASPSWRLVDTSDVEHLFSNFAGHR